MKYLNSAAQRPEDAIGYWIQSANAAEVDHLRFKSGYFTLGGLSSFKSIIDHVTANHRSITAVIGANGKNTVQSDVDALLDLIQHPRATTRVAVVGFSNALFHPKVYHLTRTDGSQLAYVGSANLTPAGVTGLNIEAGMLLDTRDGDSEAVLTDIASSIDAWFVGSLLSKVSVIGMKSDTIQLVADELLGITPPPWQSSGTPKSGKTKRSSLKPLMSPTPINPPTVNISAPAPQATIAPPVAALVVAATAAVLASDVLIAEVGKGDRWKQANFPKMVMINYFGVNPLANDYIDLISVDGFGILLETVNTKVVHVKSVNFRVELTSVNGLAYPTNGKPIAVFRRTKAKEFRYHVYMPGDAEHLSLEAFLKTRYTGPQRELKRVIVNRADILSLTPAINV